MKLFSEPAGVNCCGRWSTAEELTFLVWLGHVVTAPRIEKKAVGQWAGV